MIVSAIKQQQKNTTRFSIFFDNKYGFSLSEAGLLDSGLRIGQEVSTNEFEELKQQAIDDKLYNKALFLLSLRPRSEWELRIYLKKNMSSDQLTDKILNKLSKNGLINDESFAVSWIENRSLLKPSSRRRLISELRAKRIPDEIINQALESTALSDSSTINDVIEKKRRQSKYHDDTKLMQYLSRQGYSYGDIKDALKKD